MAMLATQAMISKRRSDLTSRYGTAATMGMRRPVAATIAAAGEMMATPKMRAALAKATVVTADSTRPLARIRRGQAWTSAAKTPSMITIAQDRHSRFATACEATSTPDTTAAAVMRSSDSLT